MIFWGAPMKRIAIFHYEWPLQIHTINLVVKLAEAGYKVDLFNKDFEGWDRNLIDIQKLNFENIHYFDLTPLGNAFNRNNPESSKKRLYNPTTMVFSKLKKIKILNRVTRKFSFLFLRLFNIIISANILNKSIQIIAKEQYAYFIGIEKKGLIWAGKLGRIFNVPFLYYNLELYVEDHPDYVDFKHLRKSERKYHKLSVGTIIQDKMRAEALLKYNGLKQTSLIYIPISVRGGKHNHDGNFFAHKFNIPESKKIILYFGMFHEFRYCTELAQIASKFPDDFLMIFHGYGEDEYIKKLQNISNSKKVLFSLAMVSDEQVIDIIKSAYIGVIFYRDDCVNNRLTAFSSEKLALFTKCGIPFVAFDNLSYRLLMKNYQCGELISDIEDLPNVLIRISENYDFYSYNAYQAFDEYYNFDKNFSNLKHFLYSNYKEGLK